MDGEVPRLIYLILLLLFIGSIFFGANRLPIGQTVKQALIWVGIFVVLIFGYSQRHVLMAELVPGTPQLISNDTIAVSRAGNGGFEAIVDINGVPVRFLVDTGASDIVLRREDAQLVGIDLDRLNFSGRALTANGAVATATIYLDSIEFADQIERNVRATVNAGDLSVSLLGMSYLDRFASIEIRGDRMLLIGSE